MYTNKINQNRISGLANYFNSVYKASDPNLSTLNNMIISPAALVTVKFISLEEILSVLRSCKNSLTMGYDGITSFLLRDCASIFVASALLFLLIFGK